MQTSIALVIIVMLVIITMVAISITIASRNKARKEIYKRSIVENSARLNKSIYMEKERSFKHELESKNNLIEAMNEKVCALKAKCTNLEETKRLEIESRDNKILHQNSEITMLKYDCSRLQDSMVESNKKGGGK